MSDSLLSYFEQELRFIRKEGALFALQHPNSASALGISKDGIDDPQISRLIESVALLNGKLHKRLDETFPEFTESLVRLLFPHFLRPIPSYSLLNFDINDAANAKHHVPAGTEFDVSGSSNKNFIFRTTEPVNLFPIKISNVSTEFAPFTDEKPEGAEQSKALIEIEICSIDDGLIVSEFDISTLKLHIKGETNFALRLYDLFALSKVKVCISDGENSWSLGKDDMTPVGFEVQDTVLPYQASSFGGFKLLTEFFMFSERFHAYHFKLDNVIKNIKSSRFKLQIYLDEMSVDLARNVSEQNFSLFCAPIVNLHKVTAEPLEVDFHKNEYPIMLESMQGNHLELFSVDEITDISDDQLLKVPQMYHEKYKKAGTHLRWQLIQNYHEDGHLTSALKVADLDHISARSDKRTWIVKATVTNSARVSHLPLTSRLKCRDSITIPAYLKLMRRPSLPIRNRDIQQSVWTLLSHLHFNYHSILGAEDPKTALKSVLHLYNLNQNQLNASYIESIINIEQEQVVAPIRVAGRGCFAYGTRIIITLEQSQLNSGATLFSCLLDKFFAFFAGFNSFTQLDIRIEGQDGLFMHFPRRSGCKNLL
ncbi:type VI secretion system baseplate subunit TssF [Shewanella sp. 202IG2-18]|uniref:type VI secretion system baseplate subunit TssF n=1 Tax=Parashewanella hymeniacidonis TaxID=2807618 RepID=UPI00195F9B8C|nr:type VI secretion system baseplate subunit TssF [Parashewanella hymeniacidonis]MBM7071364.1 type VI secretion system baseplate subunit TssF [Parashewanella hymeniacidonis]